MSEIQPSVLTQPIPSGLQSLSAHRQQMLASIFAQRFGDAFELPEALLPVCAASPFVAELVGTHPDALCDLIEQNRLEAPFDRAQLDRKSRLALANLSEEAELGRWLRQLRQREMLGIAWRDLTGAANLDETLLALTEFAETCIDAALDWLYPVHCQRFGVPRDVQGLPVGLVVLGLGKLGGAELNFSSDIDLIFAYAADGETDGPRPVDNQSFFVRLGQRLIGVLNEATADGYVFRVDMRLRPFGEAGPLAMSFDAMEQYFLVHGREWERYALQKVRVVGGDRAAGDQLLESLRPFVYRRYLDFGAFDALREMKLMINREAERKGMTGDIKRAVGGIREIEFIAQAFQLIRGGRDPQLRTRQLRRALRCLRERQLLPDYAERQLQNAYVFLRLVENRLQMVADQQTHCLPTSELERRRLAFAMGYPDWASFRVVLEQHMQRVHAQFEQVFVAPQAGTGNTGTPVETPLAQLWPGLLSDDEAQALLAELGFTEPAKSLATIIELRDGRVGRAMSRNGRQRLDRLMPLLLGAVAGGEAPDINLVRLCKLVSTVARRSVYLALLVETPLALSQLVKLCAASPWIAEYLTQHPLLLDELLDARTLYTPLDRAGLRSALEQTLSQVPAEDMDQVMDRLRHFKHVQVLKVAAADVMGVLPLMQVSDQLTWIAVVLLETVLALAWEQLVGRYGQPSCVVDGQRRRPGLAIIAYGKLGGIELGYGSDLDIVFLHDSAGAEQYTDGERSVANPVFFARLGQRIIHLLATFTPAGRLYEVDTRLRPSGAAGLLVTDIAAFRSYQLSKAWTWEHQALVRGRAVAGPAELVAAFADVRREVLVLSRDKPSLRKDVRDMRERMWAEHGRPEDESGFDLKRDAGGIGDIEFIVQYLVLAYAAIHPSLTAFTDNIRLLDGLESCGILTATDATALRDAYRSMRDRLHALALQERGSTVSLDPLLAAMRNDVRRLWQTLMRCDEQGDVA